MPKKGLFITFEGTEGAGKSTQIERAVEYLKSKGRKVLWLREPGGTRISEQIRQIILNKEFAEMSHNTELLLYLAARAQIVEQKIIPALRKGVVVICDRFEDSTLAYQGYGRGFSLAEIRSISQHFVRGKLQPDLTILLDIDPQIGMKRGGRQDRMERQPDLFHKKVYKGFKTLAAKNPKRFRVIDARLTIEEVASRIRGFIDLCLQKK